MFDIVICICCFLKESNKQRKDIKTPNLEDLNKLSAELSKLLCADVWYEIKEINVWESMPEDMQNWLVVKYPKISRKAKLDKDDVYMLCRDVVAHIIAMVEEE